MTRSKYDKVIEGLRQECAVFRADADYTNRIGDFLCKKGDILLHVGRWDLINTRTMNHVGIPASKLSFMKLILVHDSMDGMDIVRQAIEQGIPTTYPMPR